MMPGGPRNARQMQMMMRRLGMTTEPLDGVEEVIVRTKQQEHVFHAPEVTVVSVQGVTTYQVVGQPEIRPRTTAAPPSPGHPTPVPLPSGPPEEDIQLVMEQGGVPRPEAMAALAATNGEPAEAILRLLARRGPGDG
jgi:nascent polypeptide-associated complex subunit alpha